MKIRRFRVELFHADGHTDMKIIVVIRNFASDLKMHKFAIRRIYVDDDNKNNLKHSYFIV